MIARLGSTKRVVKLFSAGYMIVMPPTLAAYPRTEREDCTVVLRMQVRATTCNHVEIHRLECGPLPSQNQHGVMVPRPGSNPSWTWFVLLRYPLSECSDPRHSYFLWVRPPSPRFLPTSLTHVANDCTWAMQSVSINFPPFGLGPDGASAPVRLIAGRPRAYVVQSIVECVYLVRCTVFAAGTRLHLRPLLIWPNAR